MNISLLFWLVALLCCSALRVDARGDTKRVHPSKFQHSTPKTDLKDTHSSMTNTEEKIYPQNPDFVTLQDPEKTRKAGEKWRKLFKRKKKDTQSEWDAALHVFKLVQAGSRNRSSNYIMRKLNGAGPHAWKESAKETTRKKFELTDFDEGRQQTLSDGDLLRTTSATFQLGQGKPIKVIASLKCDPHNYICASMQVKLPASLSLMLENIMQYLVVPMSVHYPNAVTYPLEISLDIRLESSMDRRVESSEDKVGFRKITISLPYLDQLARSYPEEVVWREMMATLTHEVTHIFQWYSQRLEPANSQAPSRYLGNPLNLLPISRENSLSKNSFRVPPSVPKELLEGVADYVALRSGFEKTHWVRPTSSEDLPVKWEAGTYHKAFFFEWLEMRFGEDTVSSLMGMVLDSGYVGGSMETESSCRLEFGTWEIVTGMSIGDLMNEYGRFVDMRPYHVVPKWSWAQLYFVCFVVSTCYLIIRDLRWISSLKESITACLNELVPGWLRARFSWLISSFGWLKASYGWLEKRVHSLF